MRIENCFGELLYIASPLLAAKTNDPCSEAPEVTSGTARDSEAPPSIALYLRREGGKLVLTFSPWQQA